MTKDKVCGMMLGVAIGDQLGMPVETYTLEKIKERHGRITEYIDPDADHKWFGGMKSRWTDDTQLTLAVAESLIAKKCIDMDDMAARHVESYQKEGDLGWGKSTRDSVKRLAAGTHWSKSGSPEGFGNGVAMKVAPIGVYLVSFFNTPRSERNHKIEFIEHQIAHLANMTHSTLLGVESGLVQAGVIAYCLHFHQSSNFDELNFVAGAGNRCLTALNFREWDFSEKSLASRLLATELAPDSIYFPIENKLKLFKGATSYVYDSLPFSYSMFLENPTSIETLYNTINAGGDTDTNGSMVGALLGALNGTKIFPQHLIDGLWQKERILDTADRLSETFGIKD